MGDETTTSLLRAKLAKAQDSKATLESEARFLSVRLGEIRKTLGNPYYYGGKTEHAEESAAHFTGYQSHQPAFRIWRDYVDTCRDLKTLEAQLLAAGSSAE